MEWVIRNFYVLLLSNHGDTLKVCYLSLAGRGMRDFPICCQQSKWILTDLDQPPLWLSILGRVRYLGSASPQSVPSESSTSHQHLIWSFILILAILVCSGNCLWFNFFSNFKLSCEFCWEPSSMKISIPPHLNVFL